MPLSLSLQVPPELLALAGMDPEQPLNDVLDAWKQHAQELLDIEIANVTQRTLDRAYDTGALASSVTGRVGAGTPNLISVWFGPGPQYAEWNRYYAPYQEGPPTPGGLPTYTNEPRHMLYDSRTDDVGQISQWAVSAGGEGAKTFALRFSGG